MKDKLKEVLWGTTAKIVVEHPYGEQRFTLPNSILDQYSWYIWDGNGSMEFTFDDVKDLEITTEGVTSLIKLVMDGVRFNITVITRSK